MGTDELERWLATVDDRISALQAEMPGRVALDYTPLSLRILESLVLVHFNGQDPDEVRASENEDYTFAVAAYVGETLRRTGPSAWAWDDDPPSNSRSASTGIRSSCGSS